MEIIENYFQNLIILKKFWFLSFKVGASEHNIKLQIKRHSIFLSKEFSNTAIPNNIFDDVLLETL